VFTEAAAIAPDDAELRRSLMSLHVARGQFDEARRYAHGAAELVEIADALFGQGRDEDALGVLSAAVEADPANITIRARLASAFIARGDIAGATSVLTDETAAAHPDLMWTVAAHELRDGRIPEGIELLRRIVEADPGRRDALVILGCSVAETNADAGFECVELAARTAIAGDEWGSAAAAFNEFVSRAPNYIPALLRLVEICVEAGLEGTMHTAQAQLADAYLELGSGTEARVIAEDLVAREPWNRANIERFRRALSLLGEPDIDGIIADRLSGQSPFLTTDFSRAAESQPAVDHEPPVKAQVNETPAPELAAPAPVQPAVQPAAPDETSKRADETKAAPAPIAKEPDRGIHAVDVKDILNDEPPHHQAPSTGAESHEVDLGEMLFGTEKPAADAGRPSKSLESVLKGVREEVLQQASTPEMAEQHFKLASGYIADGMVDEAIAALEVASRSIRHRFRAGALLGKLYLNKGDGARAVEWFERASEAPAPTPAAAHQLLYELASTLEAQGETARALTLFLELRAEAGDFRDLDARLAHLTKAQAGH